MLPDIIATDTPAGEHPLPVDLLNQINPEVREQLAGPRPLLYPENLYPDKDEMVDVTLTPAAIQWLADLGENVRMSLPVDVLRVIVPTGYGLEDKSLAGAVVDYAGRYFRHKRKEEEKVKRAGQLNIGQLLAALKPYLNTHRKAPVYVDMGPEETVPIYSMDSYRGYYEELALQWDEGGSPSLFDSPSLLCSFYDDLEHISHGGLLHGYKGGDYYASADTPVWVSRYGYTDGWLVTGVVASTGEDHPGIYIQVRKIE